MRLVAHGLGCSILTVADMENPNFDLGYNGLGKESVNVMRKDGKGFNRLKTWLKAKDRAGILVWVDSSTTDDVGGYFDESDEDNNESYECSGKRFFRMLEARGEHVEKTSSYKNPGHDGRCTVYWWYFRKRPKAKTSGGAASTSRGSATKNGRAKVAKKAKAATRRVAA